MRCRKIIPLTVLCAVGLTSAGVFVKSRMRPTSDARAVSAAAEKNVAGTQADRAIQTAEALVSSQPQHGAGYIALASAYMQKVRESGDSSYYERAEAAVQRALSIHPDSAAALRALAWVQTGKHEFREALATAERARAQLPDDPLVHGILGDAALELGEYDTAEDAFQKMLDLQPGLASYSRAAYLRELYGDLDGAVEFMELAVKGGGVREPEPFAWCLVQLGYLYFHQGVLEKAETAYNSALTAFPRYYPALAALGRVRGAQQRYAEAIALYQQAVATVPAPDLVAALGDMFLLAGKPDEAEKQYAFVEYIERVNAANQRMYNRQLALFYVDHDRNLDEAVTLAETEIQQRRDIYSFDALAWVYYKKGRFADAQKAMKQALRLGTQDAMLLFHAGMIARSAGEADSAKTYLRRALALNPHFSLRDEKIARATLAELEQPTIARGEPHVSQ